MQKTGLVILGVIAAVVLLGNLGSLLALALSAFIAYFGFHNFRKSNSTIGRILWGSVLLIGLFTAISNVPAFFGIIAIIGLLYIWRKWHEASPNDIIEGPTSNDPFVNFEKQWNEITK